MRSFVSLDQCLQAKASASDIAVLALAVESLLQWAAKRNVRLATTTYGVELRAPGEQVPLTVARVTNCSPDSGELAASQVLQLCDSEPTVQQQQEFEEAFCRHRGHQRQELAAAFHSGLGQFTYLDQHTQEAWGAWRLGIWWMWCLLNPVPAPSSNEPPPLPQPALLQS